MVGVHCDVRRKTIFSVLFIRIFKSYSSFWRWDYFMRGVDIIDTPYLKGGSILAFFVGTALGLVFLKLIPKKISKPFARWFSICGGITSLILASIFLTYANNNVLSGIFAVAFFFLLSVRFAFWFYSRVIRASTVAGQQQRIAWVELGYYSGIILGLIIWKFFGIELTMDFALIIDACLQLVAGSIDLQTSRILTIRASDNQDSAQKFEDIKNTSIVPIKEKKFGVGG